MTRGRYRGREDIAGTAEWFSVHPATGVVRAGRPSTFEELAPVDWHPGGETAQDDAEERFLAAVLAFLAEPGATFTADLPLPEDRQRLHDAARAAGVTLARESRGVLAGPLIPALAGAFAPGRQLVLSIQRDGAERLHLHDDIRRTFARLTEGEAEELRTVLDRRGLLR